MNKLTGQEIIEIIKDSREREYAYEESWENLEDIGLSEYYKEKLGNFIAVSKSDNIYGDEHVIVWNFKDHNIYIQGLVESGSYSQGYKLTTSELKEVFPKTVETIIYE